MSELLKIVFAEDSNVQGLILKRNLDSMGYQSFWGKNGKLALDLIREHKPSLVVSDVEMPEMDGYTLCRSIKDDPDLAEIPVLLLTSLSSTSDILFGLRAGADAYVTKPYDPNHLMERIEYMLKHLKVDDDPNKPLKLNFQGNEFHLDVHRSQLLNLLLSTYENTIRQNEKLVQMHLELTQASKTIEESLNRSTDLLYRVLPEKIADELSEEGRSEPRTFKSVTVLFTDFVGFTKIAANMAPQDLIYELEEYFSYFDKLAEKYNIEKLKTIGDAYMAAGGVPIANETHPVDVCLFALEIREYMNKVAAVKEKNNIPAFRIRIGVHTGPLVAGVIGQKRFTYDLWGDTVNSASRMESGGEPGKINISASTYEQVKDFFQCTSRGKLQAKNKGLMEMFFLDRITPALSSDGDGLEKNANFDELYSSLN
jgi:class 3 adenylate cyclase/ActR/RegA family two-component response regulator